VFARAAFGAGVGVGSFAVLEGFGEGLGAGVGVALTLDAAPVLLFEFEFDNPDGVEEFRLPLFLFEFAAGLFELDGLFEFDGGAPRLFVLALRFDSASVGLVTSRVRFDATAGVPPPGTLTTTSNLFARCSTWAVAPGCRRNESTVLSPARWAFTSAKPRPRTASARGTSAAGIFT
jgi:hypothetical protein